MSQFPQSTPGPEQVSASAGATPADAAAPTPACIPYPEATCAAGTAATPAAIPPAQASVPGGSAAPGPGVDVGAPEVVPGFL